MNENLRESVFTSVHWFDSELGDGTQFKSQAQDGYQLVACNPQTGVNAFLVRSDHSDYFVDIPTDIDQIYVGRSFEPFKRRGSKHQIDAVTIAHIIRGLA